MRAGRTAVAALGGGTQRIQPDVGRFRETRRACRGGRTVARLVARAPPDRLAKPNE
jgi:hypothetical protein